MQQSKLISPKIPENFDLKLHFPLLQENEAVEALVSRPKVNSQFGWYTCTSTLAPVTIPVGITHRLS